MNRKRIVAGLTCLATAFAIAALLGIGHLDPPGAGAARTVSDLLRAYLPALAVAIVLFVVGLRLIRRQDPR